MRMRQLGRSALQVSEICLGTMNFGPRTPEHEALTLLDQALDHGVNLIDTANQYGGSPGVGATEELLGRWLALVLDEDVLARIDEIFPGPGPAPEAYAW